MSSIFGGLFGAPAAEKKLDPMSQSILDTRSQAAAAGLYGTSQSSRLQMDLAQQQADQQLAMQMAQMQPGGVMLVPPGTAKNMRNIHTIRGRAYRCDFCDRLTVKPDYENGCRGCGAHEWR